MADLTYAEALKIEQHRALDKAVEEGRLSPDAKAISADLLDGTITEEQAQEKYAALTVSAEQ